MVWTWSEGGCQIPMHPSGPLNSKQCSLLSQAGEHASGTVLSFLLRDAMQARSLLSCSVCPSVCLSVRYVRGSRQNE